MGDYDPVNRFLPAFFLLFFSGDQLTLTSSTLPGQGLVHSDKVS